MRVSPYCFLFLCLDVFEQCTVACKTAYLCTTLLKLLMCLSFEKCLLFFKEAFVESDVGFPCQYTLLVTISLCFQAYVKPTDSCRVL